LQALPLRDPTVDRVGRKIHHTLEYFAGAVEHDILAAAHLEEVLTIGTAAVDKFGLRKDDGADETGA
jgi:hypothetical protein